MAIGAACSESVDDSKLLGVGEVRTETCRAVVLSYDCNFHKVVCIRWFEL